MVTGFVFTNVEKLHITVVTVHDTVRGFPFPAAEMIISL